MSSSITLKWNHILCEYFNLKISLISCFMLIYYVIWWYLIFNCLRMHNECFNEIYRGKRKSAQWMMGEHNRLFSDWFQKKVRFMFSFFNSEKSKILVFLFNSV